MNKKLKESIPQGTRGIVYSYLELSEIFIKVSKLSTNEREFIKNCQGNKQNYSF